MKIVEPAERGAAFGGRVDDTHFAADRGHLTQSTSSPYADGQHSSPQRCVLVVDAIPQHQQFLRSVLEPEHEVLTASSSNEALELCRRLAPDLVLLDIAMPGLGGLEICRRLKQDPTTRETPIIFVTNQSRAEEQVRALTAGAVDYISKPLNPIVVRARVKTHLALKAQADILKSLAFVDTLTGVPNRRHFDENFQVEWRSCRRSRCELSTVLIDLDHFKQYNDRYGHPMGDDCLLRVASALQADLRRPRDFLARWGGEEFACLLPDTTWADAHARAHSMLEAIRRLQIPHETSPTAGVVTASLGVATMIPSSNSRAKLLVAADQQLYRAKREGRNRVASKTVERTPRTPRRLAEPARSEAAPPLRQTSDRP